MAARASGSACRPRSRILEVAAAYGTRPAAILDARLAPPPREGRFQPVGHRDGAVLDDAEALRDRPDGFRGLRAIEQDQVGPGALDEPAAGAADRARAVLRRHPEHA